MRDREGDKFKIPNKVFISVGNDGYDSFGIFFFWKGTSENVSKGGVTYPIMVPEVFFFFFYHS